jgi:peptidoglycan/xylan/chitin deacetylase (PgdA/CDA1 family)
LRSYDRVADAIYNRVARAFSSGDAVSNGDAQKVVHSIHGITKRRVHLTFDDGPHPIHTPRLLDELKTAGVLATFFVVGKNLETSEGMDLVRRASDEGHQIGNHTYSHPYLTKLNEDQIREQISKTESLIGKMNKGVKIFRPPYGHHDSLVDHVAQSLGYRTVLWNVDTLDWNEEHRARWVERGMEQIVAQKDSIVLAHDIHASSVEGIGKLIANVQNLSGSRFMPPVEAYSQ